jgi:phage shock protein C
MRTYHYRGIHRSRHGVVFGVFRGLANHFDFSLFWVRIIAAGLILFTGVWPGVVLYILAALLMKPEPVLPAASAEEREFCDRYADGRHDAAQRLRRRYDHLDDRIRRMEDVVTSREFDWDRRLG